MGSLPRAVTDRLRVVELLRVFVKEFPLGFLERNCLLQVNVNR